MGITPSTKSLDDHFYLISMLVVVACCYTVRLLPSLFIYVCLNMFLLISLDFSGSIEGEIEVFNFIYIFKLNAYTVFEYTHCCTNTNFVQMYLYKF